MAPVNDNFADAIELPWPLPPVFPGTTIDATLEAGEPNFGQPTMTKTVWYKFTPTTGTSLTVIMDSHPAGGTTYDDWETMTALWQDTPSGLTGITNSDLIGGYSSAYLQAPVVPGATYYLQIGGDSGRPNPFGHSGAFTLIFDAYVSTLPPANDSFEDAAVFGWPPSWGAYGWTGTATNEAGEPSTMTQTVWFTFVALQAGTVGFSFENSHYYAHRAIIYRGTELGALTLLSGPGTPVSAVVAAGQTYYVQIGFPGGYVGNGPNYELNATFTPTGPGTPVLQDAFEFALDYDLHPLSSFDGLRRYVTRQTSATMQGSGLEPGEPQPSGFALGNTLWYSFHADVRCKVEVYAGSNTPAWPVGVAVYTGDDVGALTEVFSHYPAAFPFGPPYTLTIEANTLYYAQVGRYGGQAVMTSSQRQNVSFVARPLAPNDDFADAEEIALAAGVTVTRVTPFDGAGVEYLPVREEMPSAADTGPSLWYTFTAAGPVTVEMIPSAANFYSRPWDSVIGVYTGSSLGALTEVASNDDYYGMGFGSRLTFTAAGGTYYVQAAIHANDDQVFENHNEINLEIRFTAGATPPEPLPPPKIWAHASWLEGFDEVATEDLPRKYWRVYGTPRVAQGGRFGEGGYLVLEDSGAALAWSMILYDGQSPQANDWTVGFAFRAPLSGWGDAVQEVGVCCWGADNGFIAGADPPTLAVRESVMLVSRAGVLRFPGNPAVTATIDLNAWTHITVANDFDGFLRLYLNGVLVSKAPGNMSGGYTVSLGGADPVPQVVELHYDDWYVNEYATEDAGDYNNVLGDVRIKSARVVGEANPYPPVSLPYWVEELGEPTLDPVRWEAVGASSVAEAVSPRAAGSDRDQTYALMDATQMTEMGVPNLDAPLWEYSDFYYESMQCSWLLLRVQVDEPAGTEIRSVVPLMTVRSAGLDAGYIPYSALWTDMLTTNQSIIDDVLNESDEGDYLEVWDFIWWNWTFEQYEQWRVWALTAIDNNTPVRDQVPIYKHPTTGYDVYDNGWTDWELNQTYFGLMCGSTSSAWTKLNQCVVLYATPAVP